MVQKLFSPGNSLESRDFNQTFLDLLLILQVLSSVIECGYCEPKCECRTIVLLVTE